MVTREEVAKKAGVSVSAVSRTMNGRGYVAKEKKEAILDAVRELGYRPNPLHHKQTYQICFYNKNPYSMFYMELYYAMANYAVKRGYTLFLFTAFQRDNQFLQMDGMIVESESIALEIQEAWGKNLPIPIVSASYGVPVVKTNKIPYVDADTYDALEMGLKYLMKKGHQKIAYGAPFIPKNSKTVQSRTVAFENMMKPILGKRFEEYLMIPKEGNSQEYLFEKGMQGAEQFCKQKCDATAVICFNDEYAWGMIRGLQQLGYRIPEDLSVMGIDGVVNQKSQELHLTTVALHIEQQAKECVDTLIHIIEGTKTSYFISIKPYLKEGNTVKEIR